MNQRNQAAGMFKRFENFLNRRRVEISRFKIDLSFSLGSFEFECVSNPFALRITLFMVCSSVLWNGRARAEEWGFALDNLT
jgi:hypothetical protein